jgi:hypothetical protein
MANGTVAITPCVDAGTNFGTRAPQWAQYNITTGNVVREGMIDFSELKSCAGQPDGRHNNGGGAVQSLTEHLGHSTGRPYSGSRNVDQGTAFVGCLVEGHVECQRARKSAQM